jgi:putative ABC transport system permease protein
VANAVAAAIPEKGKRYVKQVQPIPLPDLYLSDVYQADGFKGQPRFLYIFGTIAFLILFIAAINYVNLVTAQGARRAREVGVRKTMGATRSQLAKQFLSETVLLSGLALVLATGLVAGALPTFNALFDKSLTLSTTRQAWALLNGTVVVGIVSLLAGTYPAVFLAGYQPSRILRGTASTTASSGGGLRRGLVVVQFAASAGLILGTILIYQQLDFLQTKNLGFDGEQVVTVSLNDVPEHRHSVLRRKVSRHPNVRVATVGSAVPGQFGITFSNEPDAYSPQARTDAEEIELRPAKVDSNYLETLGLNVRAGRSFTAGSVEGSGQEYVLNETAVEAFGWTAEEAVGKPFTFGQKEGDPMGRVVGVVANFHIESLHSAIKPVVLVQEAERFSGEGVLAARLAPGGIAAAMDHLRAQVAQVAQAVIFNYTFLDEKFGQMYRSERRPARIFTIFAVIAIVVACMGLFALASFSAQRRTQEIGIRKALGARQAS